jgi:hypothetical protein
MRLRVAISRVITGALLANAIPHFVNGISGRQFPTPFASPPGVGLSSPMVNVVWGAANLAVAYLLLGKGQRIGSAFSVDALALAVGFFGTAIALALVFA